MLSLHFLTFWPLPTFHPHFPLSISFSLSPSLFLSPSFPNSLLLLSHLSLPLYPSLIISTFTLSLSLSLPLPSLPLSLVLWRWFLWSKKNKRPSDWWGSKKRKDTLIDRSLVWLFQFFAPSDDRKEAKQEKSRNQLHQFFTSSFCANFLAQKSYKPKM